MSNVFERILRFLSYYLGVYIKGPSQKSATGAGLPPAELSALLRLFKRRDRGNRVAGTAGEVKARPHSTRFGVLRSQGMFGTGRDSPIATLEIGSEMGNPSFVSADRHFGHWQGIDKFEVCFQQRVYFRARCRCRRLAAWPYWMWNFYRDIDPDTRELRS